MIEIQPSRHACQWLYLVEMEVLDGAGLLIYAEPSRLFKIEKEALDYIDFKIEYVRNTTNIAYDVRFNLYKINEDGDPIFIKTIEEDF